MRVPASPAACLCPLVIFLCVVSRSCYGIRVDLSPHSDPAPSLAPTPKIKSMPEPTLHPSFSPDGFIPLLKPSQLSSSKQNLRSKSQLKPRLETMSRLTVDHRSDTNNPSAALQVTSTSYARLRQPAASKQSSNSRIVFTPNSNQLAGSRSDSPERSSEVVPNVPPQDPKGVPNSEAVTEPKTESESVLLSNKKLPSTFSGNQSSSSSGSTRIYSDSSPASLSNPTIGSKTSNLNSRPVTRAQRNRTQLQDQDKDFHHRPKRGWIWNQFFVLEEHIGPEPQYVGKVIYF